MSVIDLTPHLIQNSRRDYGSSDAAYSKSLVPETSISTSPSGNGNLLPAVALFSETEDVRLVRFFDLSQAALNLLVLAKESLQESDVFLADDALSRCAFLFEEMFAFCTLSDAVGIVSLKSLLCCRTGVVTDKPNCVETLLRAVTRLRATPFMSFSDASELAADIERSFANAISVPGYNELVDILVGRKTD